MVEATLQKGIISELPQKSFGLKIDWVITEDLRLDSTYYSNERFLAKRLLQESKYSLNKVGDLCTELFNLNRFRRVWVEKEHGYPYMGPSEIFLFELPRERFVSKETTKKIEKFFVKEGWILLTCSGIVGRPLLVSKSFTDYFLSHDLIRVIPKEDVYSGYLYAFLSTWIAQALITKDRYGMTVQHIEPEHVKEVPIPELSDEIERNIHVNIVKSCSIREKARKLQNQAEALLTKELGLEKSASNNEKIFSVKSSELDLRFDASYHTPYAQNLIELMKKSGNELFKIGDPAISQIFIPPRFKRLYVGKEYGIPLLQGSDIAESKICEMKYISKKTKHLNKWQVKEGWVLVTCSGTLGRTALVTKVWDNYAVSQHALRIIPNASKLHPGYLKAFLASKWGYGQILAKTYGGVVDELSENDMKEIYIPLPSSYDIQEGIGNLTIQASELKQKANLVEDATIKTFEEMLSKYRCDSPNAKEELDAYNETFALIGNEELNVSEGLDQEQKGGTKFLG